MFRILIAHLLLLAQFSMPKLPGAVASHTPARPADTQPAASAVSPANSATAGDDPLQTFGRLTIGKLFKGERKLTPEELGHVEFWVSLIKEPLLAVVGFVPRLFVAAVFLLVFWVLYRAVRRLVVGSMGKAVDPSIRDMLGHLIKWTIMGFGLVIAFNQVGIQITALLTGVSIVGLAIGLAAQETLANFIAGIVIFWDKPFRIGEVIEIGGSTGTVQRVTFRSTRMLDGDGQVIVLPNTFVLANKLSNHSTHQRGRINLTMSIAYRESIDAGRKALLSLVEGDSRICADPAPVVVVSECADSSVKLMLRFWVHNKPAAGPIQFEYVEKAKKAFDAAGIEIPYPHLQLLTDAREPGHELRAAG